VGTKRDITRRKLAELATQRSEAELADFFENAAIGLHSVGRDGIVLRVNKAELIMLGYRREEYVGHHIAEFHVDPDVTAEMLRRLKAGETLENFETRMRCSDGTIKYVSTSSSAYCEAGQFIHTRCFTLDISEKKRNEGRLALQFAVTKILSDSSEIGDSALKILQSACHDLDWEVGVLWKVDPVTPVLRCLELCHKGSRTTAEFDQSSKSTSFQKGIGLPGRIWQEGKPFWVDDVGKDPDFPRAAIALREGLRGAFGFPILVGNDIWGVIEFLSFGIREPDQELMNLATAIGGQIGQFTQRRRAEQELAELLKRESSARAEAEKANRLKDEFLATLSHELRTPLNAVIGWSRMLNSGKLDHKNSLHAQEVIERNAWAQKQIIEDILDVSRVITGKLQLHIGPVDLANVVAAALDAVRPAMEAKEIRIESEMDSNVRTISGDGDRLQQVVWNVLSNAAKFTPTGGEVGIHVRQNGAHVLIEVKDSGPGIDPAFLPYVFERFRQADGSTTRTHGGLGLGLAIVRHLVELHGGTISVENKKQGHGAIFTISLPLPTGYLQKEILNKAESAFGVRQAIRPNLEGLEILIVEDEPDALDVITVELVQYGAKVTGVTSGDEALQALEKRKYDLLVSDVRLPDMDGYELIRRVRRQEQDREKHIPAVALTDGRVQDRLQAILAGFSTHVAKPIEVNELITVVAGLVGRLGKN
jgi:PAS domain S-box-containing protein